MDMLKEEISFYTGLFIYFMIIFVLIQYWFRFTEFIFNLIRKFKGSIKE
ncbi:hypothetical protein WG909_05895 [Peptostreptococcaceae bacterium AGR-M142]